jgi:AcrR family transcriptional regulator
VVKAIDRTEWRENRRQSARDTIVEGAWTLVREGGPASLSIRELASRVGITTPTVYAYFDSKNAIYDAMFGQAATEFRDVMAAPHHVEDPRALLLADVRRFFAFCLSETARYQLLFQRILPDFEPSPESYAPAQEALAGARVRLVDLGITASRHLDLFTALLTGLVDQQVANDPGGQRWSRLAEEAVDMFLAHCQASHRTPPRAQHGKGEPT